MTPGYPSQYDPTGHYLVLIDELLQDAITDSLHVDPTKDEIRRAVTAAATVLWQDGYRPSMQTRYPREDRV